MEKTNYVARYLSGKKRYAGDPEFSRNFFKHILNTPRKDLEWSEKFQIFAEFFREHERTRGTGDFRFFDATEAIFDVLSEEKFL